MLISLSTLKVIGICLATDMTTGTITYRINRWIDKKKESASKNREILHNIKRGVI